MELAASDYQQLLRLNEQREAEETKLNELLERWEAVSE